MIAPAHQPSERLVGYPYLIWSDPVIPRKTTRKSHQNALLPAVRILSLPSTAVPETKGQPEIRLHVIKAVGRVQGHEPDLLGQRHLDRMLQQGVQLLERFAQDGRVRIRRPRSTQQIQFNRSGQFERPRTKNPTRRFGPPRQRLPANRGDHQPVTGSDSRPHGRADFVPTERLPGRGRWCARESQSELPCA